jgi:hypothetical protein
MRLLMLTLLTLIATSVKPNDSLKVSNNQGLVLPNSPELLQFSQLDMFTNSGNTENYRGEF